MPYAYRDVYPDIRKQHIVSCGPFMTLCVILSERWTKSETPFQCVSGLIKRLFV